MMNDSIQKFFGGFVLLAAGALLALAARNLPARLAELPGNGLRDDILNTDSFSDGAFKDFVASRRRAVALHPLADDYDELAAAYTARAARDGTSDAEADRFYCQGLEAQRAALRLEPADTYGWGQMAFMTLQTDDDPAYAVGYLRLSVATAPYEPKLMPSRLDMMMGLRDYLNDGEQGQIPFVARAAWDDDAYVTVMQANRHHYLDIVENALADDADETARYRKLLKDSGLD